MPGSVSDRPPEQNAPVEGWTPPEIDFPGALRISTLAVMRYILLSSLYICWRHACPRP